MRQQKRPLGLYLHIPFCRSKCIYCDFYSLPSAEDQMDRYVSALCRHLKETAPQAAPYTVDTVYFGGGTPSYLGGKRLARLMRAIHKHYHVAKDAEVTLEANPDSLGDWRAVRALGRAGFNRLSLGVQSADDGELKALGRIHTFAQVKEAVAAARKGKIKNLSLDLIYGLPGQTLEGWKRTLEEAAALEPEHLSCYGLKVEEGTPLWRRREALTFPDDDLQADMYLWTVAYLAQWGYEQYEISNFAKPGFLSRHNMKYWTLGEYAGFGPGAHSDFGGVRYAFVRDLGAYCAGVESGGPILSEREEIDGRERDREYLMLGLRTAAGISRRAFESRCRRSFDPVEKALAPLEGAGYALRQGDGWRLTPEGCAVSHQLSGRALDALGEEKRRREEAAARGDYRIRRPGPEEDP